LWNQATPYIIHGSCLATVLYLFSFDFVNLVRNGSLHMGLLRNWEGRLESCPKRRPLLGTLSRHEFLKVPPPWPAPAWAASHWWKEFPHGWGRQRVLTMPAFVILAAEDLFVNYYGWHLIRHRRVTQWAWPGGRWTPDGALSFALHSTWYLIFLPIKEKHIPPPILVNQSNVIRPQSWIFSLMFNGRKGDNLKERKS
jgi:hypothetical protein